MNFLFDITMCLVIDQRNFQCSEVCLIYLRVSLNYALLCAKYRVVKNLPIILEDISVQDLDNFHIFSYDLTQRTRPMASCSGFRGS
jgi:hypothetical protein